jgi:hypothetical protein
MYVNTYTYNTSTIPTQSVNDIVMGSDGNYYECQTNATIDDDPVGSITGNWSLYRETVKTYGNQTVAGVKLFTSFPVTPSVSPTTDYQVANKKYVDDNFSTQTFEKPLNNVLFIKVSPSSIKIPIGFKLTVNSVSFKLVSDYTLSLNTNLVGSSKIAGTDYYVYAKSDMTFYLSANDAITADRLIGGFHYGLTAEAEVLTGNKTEADMVQIRGINAYSIWDLKFRASASNKGMVLILGKWFDIYLCNSEHITNGTSKAGAIIAGGALTQGRLYPKIPLSFGGNGTLTYGALKWFHACEIGRSHSKQNISYQEFQTIAYGVQEQVDASSQDGGAANIQHFANLTSKWGIEQATGTQFIWGSDLIGDTGGTFTQQSVTEGRGTIYSIGNSPNAVLLGGYRDDGVNAGSRYSIWHHFVWSSDWAIGCRFACDHLQHA